VLQDLVHHHDHLMCGRFFIPEMDDAPEELALLLNELELRLRAGDPAFRLKRGEICPGDKAMVIAPARNHQAKAFLMQWGYHLNRQLIFNARSETASAKPMFAASLQDRRCLIPATAYFEWNKHAAGKPKYRFSSKGHPVFYMAGLYRFEEDCKQPVFTVLTREATDDIADIHDRMPVILPPHLIHAWLDRAADPQEILAQAVKDMRWSLAQ